MPYCIGHNWRDINYDLIIWDDGGITIEVFPPYPINRSENYLIFNSIRMIWYDNDIDIPFPNFLNKIA
jgi:hypothetical protein